MLKINIEDTIKLSTWIVAVSLFFYFVQVLVHLQVRGSQSGKEIPLK